jgi:DNA-binding MarR family transcriptional regulator
MRNDGKTMKVGRPRLERISLLKAVLQGFRVRLDEELQPLGITSAQLRLLWAVETNPLVSGAELARLCSVTPQTGHALVARMEAQGLIRRRPSAQSERVLVAELTSSGRKVLVRAKELAEELDGEVWQGIGERELSSMESVLGIAVGRLGR